MHIPLICIGIYTAQPLNEGRFSMKDFLLVIALLVTTFFQIEAKEFHALLTGDTFSDVKEAASCDIKHIRKELQTVCDAINMPLHIKELKGKALTKTQVRKWIGSDAITSDDIVLFYFTGHGFRTEKTRTIWPCIFFPAKKEIIEFTDIINEFTKKSAALCVIIADCCNNFYQEKGLMPPFGENFLLCKNFHPQRSEEVYTRLFKNTTGIIIASGSTPGKRSWCTKKGSIFTSALLTCLKQELHETNPRWDHLLLETKNMCHKFQKPQFQLYISTPKQKALR